MNYFNINSVQDFMIYASKSNQLVRDFVPQDSAMSDYVLVNTSNGLVGVVYMPAYPYGFTVDTRNNIVKYENVLTNE